MGNALDSRSNESNLLRVQVSPPALFMMLQVQYDNGFKLVYVDLEMDSYDSNDRAMPRVFND